MAPTFASAAASGSNSNSSRTEGSSEWTRRANGATQTFRRTSQAANATSNSAPRESSTHQSRNSTEGAAVYIPPHVNASRNGAGVDQRYSKETMLQIFQAQQDADSLIESLSSLYVGNFHPNVSNGASAASWGRRDENKENNSVDLCWDRNARMFPMSLQEMTEDEKDLFNGSVNSPIKPPTLTNKDTTPKDGGSHRKPSISQSVNSPGAFGLSSPTSARPSNRRRETNESYPFPNSSLTSPGANSRFPRDESSVANPPASLLRRRTEQKDSLSGSGEERDRDKTEPAPSAGLKRSATGGLGASGPTAWGSSGTSAFSPMGSFGNFAVGTGTGQAAATDKRSGYGSIRGQSRFAGLMKDSSNDPSREMKEKASSGDLYKEGDMEAERAWLEARQNRPYDDDNDLYQEDELPSGSAALGGGLDDSPPKQRGFGGFGGPRIPDFRDDGGFSMLGMTSDTVGQHDFSHQTPQHVQHRTDMTNEPMSPTNTNPYQSPENERPDPEDYHNEAHEGPSGPLPGLGGFRANPGQGLPGLGSNFPGFGGRIPPQYEVAASDRSQTSSTGPARGFPSLSGIGGLPGLGGASPWSAGPQGMGTPTRDRSGFPGAFGEVLLTSTADMHSPVLAGLGGSGHFGGSGFGSVRSKMGSLFPSAMQEQMRSGEGGHPGSEEQSFDPFARQHSGLGSISRPPLGANMGISGPARDTESPFRSNRNMFDDLLDQTPRNEVPSAIGEPSNMFSPVQQGGSGQTPLSSVPSQDPLGLARKSQSNLQRHSSNIASPSTSQPPLQQMRTMVMPDRMRWIYKDPQGSTQGPWSGLEMHDWYRAGFFTPELLIKRVEDTEFEPLAQLIRRIGNSREPFLVPQIGVPHDPPSVVKTQPANTGVQPPFPNSFPSFGTTLTAEQQNALERRKQEEQFLMARQKEHLAQQQLYIKQQMGVPGQGHGLGQLHHHSSAHSLHSQPSFGSVTSPAAYQPSPTQGPMTGGQPVPGFFDGSFRQGGPSGPSGEMLGSIREGDMSGMLERMNLNRGAQPSGSQHPLGQGLPADVHSQQIAVMLQDRARLQQEQAEHDRRESGQSQEEQEVAAAQERLQQFHDLRAHSEEDSQADLLHEEEQQALHEQQLRELAKAHVEGPAETLTQQVQAASAAKQASAQQSPWGKIDAPHVDLSQRPPQSASPMPAPIAQRKHNVADTLVAESRSGTQSPAGETPTTSIAPWANQSVEVPKTLSLKEIQEAEAKRAAKQEEIAAAQRRAAYERELAAAQSAASIAPAPGLPMGATWASQSPATSTGSAPSAWGAKNPTKPGGKTLQQIQKEEEAKKQRAALAAAASLPVVAAGPAPTVGGKRYADLAGTSGSPASISANAPPGSWTTVGAGGKVKAALSPVAPVQGRAVSGNVAAVPGVKPSPVARSTTMGSAQLQKLTKADAQSEFKKWAVSELQRGGLHNSINPSDFIDTLLVIGSEVDIITEAVHGSAQTIDSRHFAEEFVRRKKQADKGVVEPSLSSSPSIAKPAENAWSAVAKKGQTPVPAASQEFKVAKAKGRKK